MTEHPFNNDSSPAERRQIVENDKRAARDTKPTTFASFAEAFADEDRGGRYSMGNRPIHTSATPVYPELPETSPFHVDPVGQEPPLGFSVEDHAPVGTAKEIQASLEQSGATGGLLDGQPDSGAAVAPASSSPPCADVVETAAPLSTFNDDDDMPPQAA